MKKIIYLTILVFILSLFTGCAKNGFHEVHYTGEYKGHSYKGNFYHNQRNGYGVYTWPSGQIYKGEWASGQKWGHGKLIWTKKHGLGYSYYEGRFLHEKPYGKGTVLNKYGVLFKGYWNGWNINSKKITTVIFKDKIIKGYFKGELPNEIYIIESKKVELEYLTKKHFYYKGKKILIPAHSKYYGYLDYYFNPTKYGQLVFSDGKNIYEGDFKKPKTIIHKYTKKYQKELEQKQREKDYKNQKCTTYKNWIYFGDQCNSNNKAHGFGKAISLDGTKSFEGEFENGLFKKGTYIYGNKKYVGELLNGRLDGYAEYYVNNKPVYKGNYKNGLKVGKGICYVKGVEEACEYKNNKRIDATYINRIKLKKLQEDLKKQQEQMKKEQEKLEEQRRILQRQSYDDDDYSGGSSSSWGDQFVQSLKIASDEIIAQKRASLEQKKANYAMLQRHREQQRREKEAKTQRLIYQQKQLQSQYQRKEAQARQRLLLLEQQKRRLEEENKRKLELQRRQNLLKQQELRRKQNLEQEKRDKQLAKQKYLDKVKNGTNLAGKRCYGSNYVGGQLPNIRPQVVSCIDVHYTVSCPNNSYNTYDGVLKNMVSNMGGCYGDISEVKKDLGCKAESFIVRVKDVTQCQ